MRRAPPVRCFVARAFFTGFGLARFFPAGLRRADGFFTGLDLDFRLGRALIAGLARAGAFVAGFLSAAGRTAPLASLPRS